MKKWRLSQELGQKPFKCAAPKEPDMADIELSVCCISNTMGGICPLVYSTNESGIRTFSHLNPFQVFPVGGWPDAFLVDHNIHPVDCGVRHTILE
jgi:hypothetical protein